MTAVEWLEDQYIKHSGNLLEMGKSFEQAKEMENKQIIEFTLFRDNYFEKADTLEDFTISNEELIRLFKNETFKSE
jgi:hypothetical protein